MKWAAIRFLNLLSKNPFYAYNPAFNLIKSDTKQAVVFRCIGQFNRKDIIAKIESLFCFLESLILIHGDDILKPKFLCCLCSNTQRSCYLSSILAIKQMTVVEQKS